MDGGRRRKGYLCKGRRGRIKAERIGEMDEVLWPAADRADGMRPPGKPRRWPVRSHIARASSHMRLPAACFRQVVPEPLPWLRPAPPPGLPYDTYPRFPYRNLASFPSSTPLRNACARPSRSIVPTFFVEPSRLFLPTVVCSPQVYPQNADKRAAPFFEAGEIEGPGPGARRRRFACTYKRYLPRIVFVAHNHFRNASVRRVRLAGLPVGRPRAIPAHSYGTKTLQSAGKLQVMTSCRDSLLLVLLISAHFS